MNITCPHCSTKLNLPDDKIPKDRDSSFKCPKCRETVHIKAGQLPGGETPPAGVPILSHQAEVLVCMADDDARTRVLGVAAQAGWAVESAPSPDQALACLEYRIFPMVLLDLAFDPQKKMADYFSTLDMSLRRRICLVLFRQDVQTGDAMAALHASSDLVVCLGDLLQGDVASMTRLLTSVRTDHESFYRVYNESMRAVGKA